MKSKYLNLAVMLGVLVISAVLADTTQTRLAAVAADSPVPLVHNTAMFRAAVQDKDLGDALTQTSFIKVQNHVRTLLGTGQEIEQEVNRIADIIQVIREVAGGYPACSGPSWRASPRRCAAARP